MKTVTTMLSLLLCATLGALGYGYVEYLKLVKENAQANESRAALVARVAVLCEEIKSMQDHAAKNKLEPVIAAVKVAQGLVSAMKVVQAATTSLTRDKATEDYKNVVESMKGRRIVMKGVIKDVGKRIISFSQMYVTLTVADGLDVKFIFEKDAESLLMTLNAGDQIVLEGYVVSTGDLLHNLTVGGPVVVDEKTFDDAVRLTPAK